MDATTTEPRIGSLARGAVALMAAATLFLAWNGGASSTGPFDLTGVICMDLYLDQTSPPPTKGLPHDPDDRLTTKILSRIEPSTSQPGAWDVTSVAYSGPTDPAHPNDPRPTKGPSAETCKLKGDGDGLRADVPYLPVSNDRPTATATLSPKSGGFSNLDYTICQDEGGPFGWVRSEFNIIVDGDPNTTDYGLLTATLNVDPQSNPEDPTSCGTTGSVTFNNVIIESTARAGTKGTPQPDLADDWDNDGCSDWNELGTDKTTGGRRDPFNPYDFYDVAGVGGPPDGQIDLFLDILGVILHYSLDGSPPYDANFDRGTTVGPNSWNMTGPDTSIDLFVDILGVIVQYGHDCTVE